jgi:hypothetical protein
MDLPNLKTYGETYRSIIDQVGRHFIAFETNELKRLLGFHSLGQGDVFADGHLFGEVNFDCWTTINTNKTLMFRIKNLGAFYIQLSNGKVKNQWITYHY